MRCTRLTGRLRFLVMHLISRVMLGFILIFTVASCDKASRGTRTYEDQTFGWTLKIPAGMRTKQIEAFAPGSHREGLVIATYSLDDMAGVTAGDLPASAVAFELLYRDDPIVGYEQTGREPHFPLRPRDVVQASPGRDPRRFAFLANGFPFEIVTFIGADATAEDRNAVDEVVRSLRFPALSEGTVAGENFYVLGPARSFPHRSATYFPLNGLPESRRLRRVPFYLVHADKGFYALSAAYGQRPRSCVHLTVNRKRLEFSCPETKARWDRMGRVLESSASREKHQRPLEVLATYISHDNHLLVSPNLTTVGLAATRVERTVWRRKS